MIGHEAVAQQSQFIQPIQPDIFSKQVEIDSAFHVATEDELAGVAPLSYVVRDVNSSDTGQTRHYPKISENVPSVPVPPALAC